MCTRAFAFRISHSHTHTLTVLVRAPHPHLFYNSNREQNARLFPFPKQAHAHHHSHNLKRANSLKPCACPLVLSLRDTTSPSLLQWYTCTWVKMQLIIQEMPSFVFVYIESKKTHYDLYVSHILHQPTPLPSSTIRTTKGKQKTKQPPYLPPQPRNGQHMLLLFPSPPP